MLWGGMASKPMAVLCLVSFASGLDGPCDKKCGDYTCGYYNASSSCDSLMSEKNCDCTGCCLAALSPFAPPPMEGA